MSAIFKRRSIRKFTNKPVSKRILTKILEAGKAAPSAKNRQPWKFIVFSETEKDKLLNCMEKGILREEKSPLLPKSQNGIADAKNTLRIMKNSHVIIIVLNTNAISPFKSIDSDSRITEICDTLSIGASVENMLLRAREIGIGSLWIANTCFSYPELTEFLNTDFQLVCAIALGYPDEKPKQRPRKADSEIIEFRF